MADYSLIKLCYYALRFFYRKGSYLLVIIEQLTLFYYFSLFVFPKVKKERPIRPRLLFGFAPIINNKYWSRAMSQANYISHSISNAIPSINSKDDFDFYIDELFPIKGKQSNWKITLFTILLLLIVNNIYIFFNQHFQFD